MTTSIILDERYLKIINLPDKNQFRMNFLLVKPKSDTIIMKQNYDICEDTGIQDAIAVTVIRILAGLSHLYYIVMINND